MKRSAVRIAVLAILLAMLPCAAQGQIWEGTTGGTINDHDQREEAQRKKLKATRPGTFATLARAARNDSRNAAPVSPCESAWSRPDSTLVGVMQEGGYTVESEGVHSTPEGLYRTSS